MDFGRKIRKLRKEKSMTQQNLADALGLHMNTISHWENLEYPFADIRKLSRLAEALGTSVSYLRGEEGPQPGHSAGQEPAAEKTDGTDNPHVSKATLDLEAIMKDLVYRYPDLAIGFRDTRENWDTLPENDKESIADALMLAFGPDGYVPRRLRKEGRCGRV
ncbi:MAG: helix-turn-helix domain-containing protein [Fretibacterium sp.]|nr:helix-turn-helix domain-containing protein [Fretibacterium sp.]